MQPPIRASRQSVQLLRAGGWEQPRIFASRKPSPNFLFALEGNTPASYSVARVQLEPYGMTGNPKADAITYDG